jgi:CheY-like chemotaxis protein
MTKGAAELRVFARDLAHEMNTPLTVVQLALASAKRSFHNGQGVAGLELVRAALKDADSAVERLRVLSAELLRLAEAEPDATTEVELDGAIDKALGYASAHVTATVWACRTFGGPPARGVANEEQLVRLVAELIIAAAKAGGGSDPDSPLVRLECAGCPDGGATIVIGFRTSTLPGRGSGFDLDAWVRAVTAWGGTLVGDTSAGRAKVRVTLAPAQAPGASGEVPGAIASNTSRPRVLIVDDDRTACSAMTRVLSDEYDVESATSARRGLSLLEQRRFDVILCDLIMPEMRGVDFYEALGKIDPGLRSRVVFMSGGAFSKADRLLLERAGNHCIDKPFDIAELQSVLRGLTA